MHLEILDKKQTTLLPFLSQFKKDFGLVGGTAIALHIGHRESLDFDLFSTKSFGNMAIQKKIQEAKTVEKVLVDKKDELTVVIDGVKITFLYFPFSIDFQDDLNGIILVADLETLAALKAYALGRRAKWKDYVDLYFIMSDHFGIEKIIKKAKDIFGESFSEKIFRTQLAYFDDIDYSEEIIFTKGNEVSNEEIKSSLIKFSLK